MLEVKVISGLSPPAQVSCVWEKLKTVDFSETIKACDLKDGRCRQLIELMKVWKVKVISWKKNSSPELVD